MDSRQLRQNIINEIHLISNEELKEVRKHINMQKGIENDVYVLNEDQKHDIQTARDQYKEGQFFTDEEVNKELDQWLNEQ